MANKNTNLSTSSFRNICQGILGNEKNIPKYKKILLALYFTDLLCHADKHIKDRLDFIGQNNILLELCAEPKAIEEIFDCYCNYDYAGVGNTLSETLAKIEKRCLSKIECLGNLIN